MAHKRSQKVVATVLASTCVVDEGDDRMGHVSRRSLLRASVATSALALCGLSAVTASAQSSDPANTEWRSNGGDLAYTRYAPLTQINADNFSKLQVAWRFRTDALGPSRENNLEATPLLVKGRLYMTAGTRRDVVCLDATTGELLWIYRLDEGARARNAPRQLSGRGVGYWAEGDKERIIFVTIGYQMVSLDAKTGFPDPDFGTKGIVDLKQNIDQDLDLDTADIGLHTAPTIAKGVIII
ncbi:MAG: PQQ-binding-like beta-propeller repeat protein, partial [Caulobacteraceae bacterium]|nr:PQQ-binding-like beta-propeller repeat protein [Caulobacteraceae bacterium]